MRQWMKDNRWPVVTIAVLFVVNAVLIGLLLLRPQAPVEAVPGGSPSSASSTRDPSRSASPTTETSADATPSEDPSTSSASPTDQAPSSTESTTAADGTTTTRLLTMGSATQGWRATVGTCDTAGTVEATNDGGRTWTSVPDPEMSPLSRLQATDRDTLFAIGGGNDCKATYAISYTAGQDWEARNGRLAESWYVTPRDRTQVRASTGDRSQPCEDEGKGEVLDLASMDNRNAAVLCSDGRIRTSDDAGHTWGKPTTLPGAVALGADADGYVVASLIESCAGVAVTTFSESQAPADEPTGCAPAKGASAGQVAVTTRGGAVWVWAGDQVAVSRDSGSTW